MLFENRLKLSVIILTWNSKEFLCACLSSLYASLQISDYEIIVVDNGSQDGTAETIRQDFPEINLIKNNSNRGVAPARNQALQVARGEFLLFLDVDTVVGNSAVETLIQFLEDNPAVGLVAPKLVYPNGQLQYSCRKFPTVWTKVLRRIPQKLAERFLSDELYEGWNYDSVREVDYVIGACQLIRRKVFEEVGYLDDRMFYGPEDVDYCLRLRMVGWKVTYNPKATIIHKEQRVTKSRFFSIVTWRHLLALIRYFNKHHYWFSRKKIYIRLPTIRLIKDLPGV